MSEGGGLVVAGLQQTGAVAVLQRDLAGGCFVREVAWTDIEGGEVVCVGWNE
jgi:hypothetical protein